MIDLSCGTNGGSHSRIMSQSMPAKKGCALISAALSRPIRCSADVIILEQLEMREKYFRVPSHKIFSVNGKMNIIGKTKCLSPMSDFNICLIAVFSTEWWITAKTFKHDGSQTPPVTLFTVSFACKNLWGDIVWRAYSRVGHQASIIPSHCEDPLAILGCHCEVDSID